MVLLAFVEPWADWLTSTCGLGPNTRSAGAIRLRAQCCWCAPCILDALNLLLMSSRLLQEDAGGARTVLLPVTAEAGAVLSAASCPASPAAVAGEAHADAAVRSVLEAAGAQVRNTWHDASSELLSATCCPLLAE